MFITDSWHHSEVQMDSQKFGLEFLYGTRDNKNAV